MPAEIGDKANYLLFFTYDKVQDDETDQHNDKKPAPPLHNPPALRIVNDPHYKVSGLYFPPIARNMIEKDQILD